MAKKRTPEDLGREIDDVRELLTGKKSSVLSASSTLRTSSTLSTPSVPEEIRKTYLVRSDYVKRVKDLAYWERKEIREIIADIFATYFDPRDRKEQAGQLKKKVRVYEHNDSLYVETEDEVRHKLLSFASLPEELTGFREAILHAAEEFFSSFDPENRDGPSK